MKIKEWVKKNWNYIVVFLVPWIIVILHGIIRSSWLTGESSLLYGDTKIQLYPLFVELWNKVHAGESLFFSWNGGNGFDFYLNMAYYLISPFNILVLILPKQYISIGLQLIIVLKWSLTGVTMAYYFMHTKNNGLKKYKKLVSVVLGLAFSLSNNMIMVFGFFNWTDVIIIFPILLLLLENMIENGSWKRYYLFLTLSMLCNFYMTYQVCIFLLIWFFIQMKREQKNKRKKTLTFILSSVLAALTSCIVIIPSVLGVSSRYGSDSVFDIQLKYAKLIINSLYDFGCQMFIFENGLMDLDSSQPRIYFSIGFMAIAMLYFVIKISIKDKLKYALLWLFFVISCCSGALVIFWHGFAKPNGIYHRFLYLFIFLMLYMGVQVLDNISTLNYLKVFGVALAEIILLVYTFFHVEDYQDFYGYLITAMLFVLYQMILILYLRKSIEVKHVVVVCSVFIILELCGNAIYEFGNYEVVTWNDFRLNGNISEVVEDVELEPGERVDLLQSVTNNGLYEGLPNTNLFVSYCNGKMVQLYNKLGLSYSRNATCQATGTSPLTNLMFNIRYGSSTSEVSFSDVEQIGSSGDMKLYRMNRLAGLGYMVDKDIVDWDTDYKINFDLENDFIQKATGENAIFEIVYPEAVFTDGYFNYQPKEAFQAAGYYDYDYVAKNIEELEYTDFSFIVPEDMDLYMNACCTTVMTNIIMVDGKQIYCDSGQDYLCRYHIGEVKKGQQIHIYSKHAMEVGEETELWFRFAKFNEEHYATAYEKLSENIYEVEEMGSDYVSGSIESDEDGYMMTSVPAMKGFQVYVDGERTEYEEIGDAFIAVPVKKGTHKIEFKYCTPYFVQGAICTVIGMVLFIGICLHDVKFRKIEEK